MVERKIRKADRQPRTKAAVVPYATATPFLVDVLALLDGTVAGYAQTYRKLPQVRTVVDFLGDAVSTTPLKVYRRAPHGRPEARDHPLAQLLRKPNGLQTLREMLFRVTADLAIYGNAYWRIVMLPNMALVPLPPHRVTPRGGDVLAPTQYDFNPPNGVPPIRIPRSEIIHFKLYDPEDPRVGSSKLEALRMVLIEEVEMTKHRRGYWQNAARAEGWIEFPETAPELSETAHRRLREELQAAYASSGNAGKIGILEAGAKFNPAGFSARDSELTLGRQFIFETTARVFNVPLPLLSLTPTATYASLLQYHKALYQDTLPPWYETIQSSIELALMPLFTDTETLYVEFEVEAKVRGDVFEQAAMLLEATGRPYMTVHEVRDLLNLSDRGDVTDDELAIPTNNVTLGTPPPPEPAPALALVASLQPERTAALVKFFDHQERVTLSRWGAGRKEFDVDRWTGKLAPLLGSNGTATGLAGRITLQTAVDLEQASDVNEAREVFERVRNERIPQIVQALPA